MSKKKPSISFEDLGLSCPAPELLTKSAADRQREKLEMKKQKNNRIQTAVSSLAEMRSTVEKHKSFVKEEKSKEASEKEARKRLLRADHVKARRERDMHAQEREASLVSDQKSISARVASMIAEEEETNKRLQSLIEMEQDRESASAAPALNVPVRRKKEIEETRSSLPVLREEQAIVEAINESKGSCVLICGETGSGKTTQVPQFLWECGYGHPSSESVGRQGMIVVTEPRRVAAVAMARRVAEELCETFGDTVGYQVRYDNNLSERCKLKFVTEGILLRELQNDFLLKKYSVVVVDEAHERSVSGDILVGMLSRTVPLRSSLAAEGSVIEGVRIAPLKLVIMSATLRVSDFKDNQQLFPISPPLINVEARRFPVTNHFARTTELRNYCDEAFKKVLQIHKKLPPGGILVFLCTQREIESTCERLRRHYRKVKIAYNEKTYTKHALADRVIRRDSVKDAFGLASEQYDLESSKFSAVSNTLADFGLRDDFDYNQVGDAEVSESESLDEVPDEPKVIEREIDDEACEDDGVEQVTEALSLALNEESEEDGTYDSLHILPLYALLKFDDQQRVFQEPPPGKRLCVVATNVAETSITIPGIRYVVDAGRVKNKKLDRTSGASTYAIEWTSQASAEQRCGRAGRTGPGHCYKLYSTAVFTNQMPKHSTPEILRTPIESVVLLMKSLGIQKVANFPFPSPPQAGDIECSLKHLIVIGALEQETLQITGLGEHLLHFPVAPRFAKMIVTAAKTGKRKLQEIIVTIVAVAATTLDIFEHGTVQETGHKSESTQTRVSDQKRLISSGSDMISYLRAAGVFTNRPTASTCSKFNIIHKSMTEANQLRRQLMASLSSVEFDDALTSDFDDPEAADSRTKIFDAQGVCSIDQETEVLVRKLVAIGLIDQVARRASVHECRSHGVPYTDGKTSKVPYWDVKSASIVFVHPSSSVALTNPPPEVVVYVGLYSSKRSEKQKSHTFMKGVTIVTKEWLSDIGFDEDIVRELYVRPVGAF